MLNERQKKILKLIIDRYIVENNLISSLSLSKTDELKEWSSATIRNDMFVLEELGYLKKEYYSSGKLPTKKGYRFYIECLMSKFNGNENIEKKMVEIFSDRHASVDNILDKCAKLISEFLNLPTVLIKNQSIENDYLRKLDVVNLDKNRFLIYIITLSGNMIQDIVVLDECDEGIKDDLLASVKLLNERLFDCPVGFIQAKLNEVLPEIKRTVHRFEFIYESIISKMIFKKLLDRTSFNPKIYNAKSLICQPEVQKNEIDVDTLFNILENFSPFSPINFNYLKTGKTLFNLDENKGLSVATTTLDLNLAIHQLSVIGPIRMNYPLIKYLFDFLNEKLRS